MRKLAHAVDVVLVAAIAARGGGGVVHRVVNEAAGSTKSSNGQARARADFRYGKGHFRSARDVNDNSCFHGENLNFFGRMLNHRNESDH
jgi:predicted transcriptional regulator